jgi:hypothetical protein
MNERMNQSRQEECLRGDATVHFLDCGDDFMVMQI